MQPSRGHIVRMHSNGNAAAGGGIECCFCQCFTCINFNFLKSEAGILKLAETVLGSFCQSLAINYGLGYANTLGSSFHSFLTTASWCLMTTLVLLCCYIFSVNSFNLIRQSVFETVFNAIACISYVSACSYLGFAVNTFLYPQYLITPYFQVYPAMTAAYMIGTVTGLIYGYDAYQAYKIYKK